MSVADVTRQLPLGLELLGAITFLALLRAHSRCGQLYREARDCVKHRKFRRGLLVCSMAWGVGST